VNVCLETSIFVGAYLTRGRCADVLLLVLAGRGLITAEVVLSDLARVSR
jgi:hypothetical protein